MATNSTPPNADVIARPEDPDNVPVATHYRGTWVTTSLASLREKGLLEAYTRELPLVIRDAVLFLPAMSWASSDLVEAHYEACDRLGLSAEAAVEMGVSATQRLKTGTVVLGYTLAASTGITPWTLLERLDKVWNRAANGGAISVQSMGPKEARIEIFGFPLARISYIRNALRGVIRGAIDPFAKNVYVTEAVGRRRPNSLALRTQWV